MLVFQHFFHSCIFRGVHSENNNANRIKEIAPSVWSKTSSQRILSFLKLGSKEDQRISFELRLRFFYIYIV